MPVKTPSDNKDKTLKPIYAAGGVVYRIADKGSIQVSVIHRPYYDDWSLPKGKLDKGETILDSAWRELTEETGYTLAIRGYLRKVSYQIWQKNEAEKNSRNTSTKIPRKKYVYYWAAEVIEGNFIPNEEADKLLWLSTDEASKILTYSLDLKVLQIFASFPAHAQTLAIVRHARAGDPLHYKGNDEHRPLDKTGQEQALSISRWLMALHAKPLYSATKTRCIDTLQPYASAKHLPITLCEDFNEEFCHNNPDAAYEAFQTIARDNHGLSTPVISSQGGVIPTILKKWSHASEHTITNITARKGSLWLISHQDGVIVRTHYLPNPLHYPLGQ